MPHAIALSVPIPRTWVERFTALRNVPSAIRPRSVISTARSPLQRLRLALYGLCCLTFTAAAGAAGDPGSAMLSIDRTETVEIPNPKGSDPLTPSEVNRARGLADLSQRVQKARRGGTLRRPRALQQLQRVQYLYSERNQDAKVSGSNRRRANVYYYNYANDEIIRQVVDLRTGTAIETTSTAVESQPPVTSAETKAGIQLILDHPQLGPSLRGLYRQLSGQDLTRIEQLQPQAGIFHADNATGTPLANITGACAQHRCIHFFLPYGDGQFIDATNLVVDLSAGQVLWVDQGLTLHVDADLPASGDSEAAPQ